MRGIVIDPGAKPELYRLPDTLQELQRFMGGYAQRCPIDNKFAALFYLCLLYTSPSPRDA